MDKVQILRAALISDILQALYENPNADINDDAEDADIILKVFTQGTFKNEVQSWISQLPRECIYDDTSF